MTTKDGLWKIENTDGDIYLRKDREKEKENIWKLGPKKGKMRGD